MRAGRMDRRVVIQTPTESGDTYGAGGVTTYATLATVWAQMVPERGQEVYQSAQLDATRLVRWRIRWRNDVTINELCRLVYDGVTYEINAVLELGRREGLDLLTRAHIP